MVIHSTLELACVITSYDGQHKPHLPESIGMTHLIPQSSTILTAPTGWHYVHPKFIPISSRIQAFSPEHRSQSHLHHRGLALEGRFLQGRALFGTPAAWDGLPVPTVRKSGEKQKSRKMGKGSQSPVIQAYSSCLFSITTCGTMPHEPSGAGFAGRGRRSRYTANCSIRVLTKLQFRILRTYPKEDQKSWWIVSKSL